MPPPTITTLASGLRFPEGPAFATDGSLWAVELKGESLIRYQNGHLHRYPVGGVPNGIAIDKEDFIWYCDAGGMAIKRFNPLSGEAETIINNIEGKPLNKPNDLAFDSRGNLVFTCPGESRKEPTGYACVLMKNGMVKKITEGKYFPNGLAFSANGNSLVMAETYRHRLLKGDWDCEKGTWYNERVWCEIGGPSGPGGPDGMAFDEEGNLYVAVYGTGMIRVVNRPVKVIESITMPGQNPTNCAFDPFGVYGLIVTEAENGTLISFKGTSKAGRMFS